jgi:hypothetical protein
MRRQAAIWPTSAARGSVEQDLTERYREIATLTIMLREQVEAAQTLAAQQAWLRAVWANLRRAPEWWATLPAAVQRKLELRRLSRAGLFDGAAYLADNPDVAASGMGALDHYIMHGMAEGAAPWAQGKRHDQAGGASGGGAVARIGRVRCGLVCVALPRCGHGGWTWPSISCGLASVWAGWGGIRICWTIMCWS